MAPRAATKSPSARLAGFLAKYDPKVATVARAALARMRKLVPRAYELVYDNYNFLVIGIGLTERPSEAVFSVVLAPSHVSLCFVHGAKLPDPQKILRGGGNQVRNVRLEDGAATLDRPEVRALIAAALEGAVRPAVPPRKRQLVIRSVSRKQRPRRVPARTPRG